MYNYKLSNYNILGGMFMYGERSMGIEAVKNKMRTDDDRVYFTEETIDRVRRFHMTIPNYANTPLVSLDELANELGLKSIFVKDESKRFGLNAFKVLGASFAVAQLLCEKLEVKISEVDFNFFKSSNVKESIKDMVFVTATDGNHGKGLAWAASQLGCKAIIYMPKGSSLERVRSIESEGAEVIVTELNYDDAVRLASKTADENGWNLVQDTAWVGYEKIPTWIMEGYLTMADEAFEQMLMNEAQTPTHIFLQAGVGCMAGSVLGYYASKLKKRCPIISIVEPLNADCIFKSIKTNDGNPHPVYGDLETIMAGLSCGEPNPITWSMIKEKANFSIVCDDQLTMLGMRILASPIGNDKKIISGESGAVGVGVIHSIMKKKYLIDLRKDMELDNSSVVLIISTEGDTDKESYKRIVG